jgi:hypothetical protein
MTMKKTLGFEKETLRTLVSMELDAVIGGGAAQPTHTAAPTYTQSGGVAHPTSTAVGTFTPTAVSHPFGTFTPTAC